jgi:hypothetical protein
VTKADDPSVDPDIDTDEISDDSKTSLWPEDTGTLTIGARRALVLLLKRQHVWAARNPREWAWLLKWQFEIEARLNDVFLELVVDKEREVAYKRQAGRDQGRQFTTLLHDNVYSREEAAVLLHIRDVYQREMRAGNDAAYIDKRDLVTELDYVRPERTKDHKKADGYLDNAFKNLQKDGFLLADRNDDDRLRISPVIEVLLTVERVNAFREALYVEDGQATDDPEADMFGDTSREEGDGDG